MLRDHCWRVNQQKGEPLKIKIRSILSKLIVSCVRSYSLVVSRDSCLATGCFCSIILLSCKQAVTLVARRVWE